MKKLKLFEALALKKSMQAQLAQLISLRNSTFEYPEDEKKPDMPFADLTLKIKQKVNDVTKLKIEIMKANMNHELPNGLTLYEGIIELANVRSAIDQLKELGQVGRHGLYMSERRRSMSDIKMLKQVQSSEILDLIDRYDARRRVLDAHIQDLNHSIEIDWDAEGE